MAGATAATAAGVTASQASTITINLVNNYISAVGGNHLECGPHRGWTPGPDDSTVREVLQQSLCLLQYRKAFAAVIAQWHQARGYFIRLPICEPATRLRKL